MAIKILVVDDEVQMQHLLQMALTRRGYEVSIAADGQAALDLAITTQPDLVILDLSLPTLDGLEVCRRIRSWSQMPIVVLSAREGDRDKVDALDLGADDYVTKPFSMEELLARLRVALRHAASALELTPIRQCGELSIDLNRRLVLRAGVEVHLTPTEYDLLGLFITNADRVLTQRQILRKVWGSSYENDVATLRVFIGQLRQKIEPEPSQPRLIVTETGVGYRFRCEGCR
jgi:two-component system, OmpR family, KDP operon response regulator KdpE